MRYDSSCVCSKRNNTYKMKTLLRYLCVASTIMILSGCKVIDTYYTYDSDYLAQLEKDFGGVSADANTKKVLEAVLTATQIRIVINIGSRNTLMVHKSYKQTENLKKLTKGKFDTSSDIQKYPDCDYFNEQHWVCENFFAMKYEMKKGELFIGGRKLKKNYALKF